MSLKIKVKMLHMVLRYFIDLYEKARQAADTDLSEASSLYNEEDLEDLDSCQSGIDQKHCTSILV